MAQPIEQEKHEEEEESEAIANQTFLTGVEIDVDQWRAQTVEELTTWLQEVQSKKTEFGDPVVEFPEGWDKASNMTQKEQFDLIQTGISRDLKGPAAKEAQADLLNVRQQAERLRQLEKDLNALESDDEENEDPTPDELKILDEEITVPEIDTSGPNPFEIPEGDLQRLKEIDEKLGSDAVISSDEPPKSLEEIDAVLMQLYSKQAATATNPEEKTQSTTKDTPPQSPPQPTPQQPPKRFGAKAPIPSLMSEPNKSRAPPRRK